MTTNNNTPKIPQATLNYFDESFAKEGLKYVKRDLERQIEKTKSDFLYWEEQAKQFAIKAKIEQDRIEGMKYELAAVNAALKQKTAGII